MTRKPRIIADDKIPFLRGALEPYAEVIYKQGAAICPADVRDADAIFTRTRTRCDAELLEGSSVRLIATATIGYDHIDTAYCEAKGIRWVNAPGCNSGSVCQYIAAALLLWAHERGRRLHGLTLGVIGVGNVGGKVAVAAEGLGMRVLLNDPPRAEREGPQGFTELARLLAESDIVTCHTPLASSGPYPTRHLASDGFFGQMKPGAVFINSSRGPVADTAALRRAMDAGKLSDVILDVWENEPDIDRELMQQAFIATPHIAGYSADGKANGTAACVREAASFFGITEVSPQWFPADVPAAEASREIRAPQTEDTEEALRHIILHTYPIEEDSRRLKQSPETFEQQRSNYRIRREPPYFRPLIATKEAAEALRKLRFTV
ncbi:MAG: 4-phosphoerythronate dehydrogenase [Tannerellaceae bacterium]|jgi:erythronate-4-phosphate dehydrogenase|nr:4-phosphoerythronate dehydrogenase [Tannerellaceae bacterium]